jgi:hypothetical protein
MMRADSGLSPVIVGGLAGLVVGPVMAISSRIVMRVLALAGRQELKFTLQGSLEILATVVVINVIGGLAYGALRQYVPGSGISRGLAFGVILLLTIGIVFFIAEHSFGEFEEAPPLLIISLFGFLFILYGILLEVAVTLVQRVTSGTG